MKVGLMGVGQMGSAIAERLIEHGCHVVSPIAERSSLSIARATSAGIRACHVDELGDADFLLSIAPSSAAAQIVDTLTPMLTASAGPVFIEANALHPRKKCLLLEELAAHGVHVIDASIIGPPPRKARAGPRIYAAGSDASRALELRDYGLDVRVLTGQLGSAAALKLSYAALNKGSTALMAAVLLMAEDSGTINALNDEWSNSQPALAKRAHHTLEAMYPKARRWISEFEEIAAFARDADAGADIFSNIARFFDDRADAFENTDEAPRLLKHLEREL